MNTRRLLLGSGLLGVLLATGCASMAPPPVAGPALSGRLAWQVAAHAGEPARQASALFELRGSDERGSLELSSVLGTLLARARWEPGSAELTTPAGVERFAGLAELARSAFGEPLPLGALFDWLRGRPWPGAPHEPEGAGFRQLGWQVDLGALAQGLLSARRAAEPAVTLRLRLEPAP